MNQQLNKGGLLFEDILARNIWHPELQYWYHSVLLSYKQYMNQFEQIDHPEPSTMKSAEEFLHAKCPEYKYRNDVLTFSKAEKLLAEYASQFKVDLVAGEKDLRCTCQTHDAGGQPLYGGYARCPIHDPNMKESFPDLKTTIEKEAEKVYDAICFFKEIAYANKWLDELTEGEKLTIYDMLDEWARIKIEASWQLNLDKLKAYHTSAGEEAKKLLEWMKEEQYLVLDNYGGVEEFEQLYDLFTNRSKK